jgi:hypothetical protein
MQLNIVKPKQGITWVKMGIRVFFKQPLALSGLFFIFMAMASVLTVLPFIGSAVALALLPAATLGLMAATSSAAGGKFPMPVVLATAFRAGKAKSRNMLILGAIYALCFLGLMAITSAVDGGQLAKLYLLGGKLDKEMLESGNFQSATWVFLAFYSGLSMLFWHAPGLVFWHDVPPVKALFFSAVAVFRSMGAYLVYGLGWLAVFAFGGVIVTTIAALISPGFAAVLMLPFALLMASMFFTSIYFTFVDSFTDDLANGTAPNAPPV